MASPSEEQSPTIQPPVVFRSNRKRKAGYRQRPGSQDIDIDIKDATASPEPSSSSVVPTSGNHPTEPAQRAPSTEAAPSSAVTEAQADDDPSSQSIAEALRLRNLRKSRLKGVGFRPQDGRNAKHDAANPERGLTHGNQDADAVELGIAGRFAPQTGTVGELVNKHMMEYIESKLSSRRAAAQQTTAATGQDHASSDHPFGREPTSPGPTAMETIGTKPDPRAAAIRGRLMEVDLGEEARARNIALTERARRRLASLAADDSSPSSGSTDDAVAAAGEAVDVNAQRLDGPRPRKERLGSEEKSRRSRQRRASEDLERDRLVEQFIQENKLDVYDLPDEEHDPNQNPEDTEENLGADDRLVEKFRREFMEAMSLRRRQQQQQRRRRRPANPAGSYNSRVEKGEVLRGPKLGGSRNERAAMRDLLLQKEKEKRQATKR